MSKKPTTDKNLKSKKGRYDYLGKALEDYHKNKNLPLFLLALREVVVANGGFSEIALKANLSRKTLYKALSPKGNPSFALVSLVFSALGMRLVGRY
jgi:probable addiction module antidote protein